MTSPARTVLDLAPGKSRQGLDRLFSRADELEILDRRRFEALAARAELDAYWEAEGFAVELDVYATHGSPRSFETDREREDDLLLAGIELIRVTDRRLDREPRETIARVAAHLERRRRAIGPRRSVA